MLSRHRGTIRNQPIVLSLLTNEISDLVYPVASVSLMVPHLASFTPRGEPSLLQTCPHSEKCGLELRCAHHSSQTCLILCTPAAELRVYRLPLRP